VPVKTAMSILGRCRGELRAPLGPPEAATRQTLESALRFARLV
jgi:dihydrodipicolinate synthase/N-acetylneuraminate lyase